MLEGGEPTIRNHRPLARRERAYTLIEVMCAAAMAAILFVALFSGISQGFNMVQMERENMRATQIAMNRVEGLRLESWSLGQLITNGAQSTTFVPATFTDTFYPVGLGGFNSNAVIYAGTVTITPGPFTNIPVPSYNNSMALVTVSLTWTDAVSNARNIIHTRTFKTYAAQYGMQNYVFSSTNN